MMKSESSQGRMGSLSAVRVVLLAATIAVSVHLLSVPASEPPGGSRTDLLRSGSVIQEASPPAKPSKPLSANYLRVNGWTLFSECADSCGSESSESGLGETPGSVVATPTGTTYSVHHRVGGDLDGGGPQPVTCVRIHDPALPGAFDDIVNFDQIAETIRTDQFGTVPAVIEFDAQQVGGGRRLTIETSSPAGTDLFPAGVSAGELLTDACFTIGLDDPLDWEGLDVVTSASIQLFVNEVPLTGFQDPVDIRSLFSAPWDGTLNVILADGAGNGINKVRVVIVANKILEIPNDNCGNRILISDETVEFSTIGATTDGLEHPAVCNQGTGDPHVQSDIWYEYHASCTGTLTVDLCDSDYDTKFAIYRGCSRCPPTANPVACNDDFCGPFNRQSFATVPATEEECFIIRVGGWQNSQGNGTMHVSCNIIGPPTGACCVDNSCIGTHTETECLTLTGAWFEGQSCPGFACPQIPPFNDECDHCTRIETGIPKSGSTSGATGVDESVCIQQDDMDTKDVWLCWTADCSGQVTVETCGGSSSFDTVLSVFDACGGTQLACNDQAGGACNPRSRVTFSAVRDQVYVIRVAGFQMTTGQYEVLVSTCRNACCIDPAAPGPDCGLATPAFCQSLGGSQLGQGTVCLLDGNMNGVDDACEGCPAATIVGSLHGNRVVDAREPHASNAELPRFGIGTPQDPIRVQLSPQTALAEGCFSPCETSPDDILGSNFIDSVNFLGSGRYDIILDHAVASGEATTIEYRGGGSFVEFRPHPGNVNGDTVTNFADVLYFMDCCLEGNCSPPLPWGIRSCDADRSTLATALDIWTLMNLLLGSDQYQRWDGTTRPDAAGMCPR